MKEIDELTHTQSDVPEKKSKPSRKAKKWAKNNPWFLEEGNEAMTSLAYGLHTRALERGIKVDSDDYYNYIDRKMREYFPKYAWTYDVPEEKHKRNSETKGDKIKIYLARVNDLDDGLGNMTKAFATLQERNSFIKEIRSTLGANSNLAIDKKTCEFVISKSAIIDFFNKESYQQHNLSP